jgi:hypothetical protein
MEFYFIGSKPVNFISTDTDEIPRYVENPEWKIKNIEEQIETLKQRDEYYDQQADRIISLKGQLSEQIKTLKKELKSLRNSKE